jgi:hypothetical protein
MISSGSYPLGPAMRRFGSVITLWASKRTTTLFTTARVVPDLHAPDSRWDARADKVPNVFVQLWSTHGIVFFVCILDARCSFKVARLGKNTLQVAQ